MLREQRISKRTVDRWKVNVHRAIRRTNAKNSFSDTFKKVNIDTSVWEDLAPERSPLKTLDWN